jgi:hypothetical protein
MAEKEKAPCGHGAEGRKPMFNEVNYRKAIFALAKDVRNGLWNGPFEARVRLLARSFDVPRRAVRRDVWALLGRTGKAPKAGKQEKQ